MQPASSTGLFLASCFLFLSLNNNAIAAPFSSWAGKRSSTSPSQLVYRQLAQTSEDLAKLVKDLRNLYFLEENELDDIEDGGAVMIKRAPFSSWAGKRAPFSSWAGKRAPFSSWAGKKRSSEEIEDDYTNHRVKRSSDEMEVDDKEQIRQRRGANSFSAWGGKRSADEGLRRFARNAPVIRVLRPQRAAFSAWGG